VIETGERLDVRSQDSDFVVAAIDKWLYRFQIADVMHRSREVEQNGLD
jgi:hypothetical protein